VNVCDAAAGDAAAGDTATITDTVVGAAGNLRAVSDGDRVADRISGDFVGEAVLGKGHHSRQTLAARRCWTRRG